jgi:hypothetical protein
MLSTMYDVPNRGLAPKARAALIKLSAKGSRTDTPNVLPLGSLKLATELFQPRFESMAFAMGRSHAHIDALAKIVRRGGDLDAVTAIAFGQGWYLINGHHRVKAYTAANRVSPIPVQVLHSELAGAERVAWAIKVSVVENNKNSLNMSTADKRDTAWRAVMMGEEGSKNDAAKVHDVSEGLIAKMRVVKRELEGFGRRTHFDAGLLHTWAGARGELAQLTMEDTSEAQDGFEEQQRRELAKRLDGAMKMCPTPGLLAQVLEAFEPGIVAAMMLSWVNDDDDDIDEIGIPDGKAPPGDMAEALEGEEAWDAEAREQLDALAREEPDAPIGA